ncbi:helix-turn-helix domain-containing protein [Sphingosinicella rhizophila]|uniref:Helix-turn-helix domain-containing protein n=1 Tax=Sphingosinicella rhizophila TaxID=3050082 RepID=A0ABU3Q5B3_9SPHN|nr:helix-turn-helix domain-containing protein [Sphingosinicella sp. GR2756]MDT9598590.1 helix-turn-helix domain-containing protein [Sphingosinicella sp. GR2756]
MTATSVQPPDVTALTVRIPQAARMLGIGKTKLYELIGSREIEVVKVGRATLVVVTSLHAFVDRQRIATTADEPVRRRPGRPRISFVKLAAGIRS